MRRPDMHLPRDVVAAVWLHGAQHSAVRPALLDHLSRGMHDVDDNCRCDGLSDDLRRKRMSGTQFTM